MRPICIVAFCAPRLRIYRCARSGARRLLPSEPPGHRISRCPQRVGHLMSITERRLKATVMDAEQIRRSLSRIAHEIVERNHGAGDLVLVGIFSKGDHLARRLAAKLLELEGTRVAVGLLDTSNHRDDRHLREPAHRAASAMPD